MKLFLYDYIYSSNEMLREERHIVDRYVVDKV